MKNFGRGIYTIVALVAAYAAGLLPTTAQARPVHAVANAQTLRVKPSGSSTLQASGRQVRMKNFKTKSHISEKGGLVIESFSAEIGGGRVAGVGKVDLSDKSATQKMRVQLSNVDLAQLAQTLSLPLGGALPGKVSGTVDVAWLGSGYDEIRHSVTGNADLRFGASEFANLVGLDKLAEFAGVPGLKELAFTSGEAKLTADAGKLTVTSVKLSGPGEEFTAKGTIDLTTDEIDGRIDVAVASELAQQSENQLVRDAAANANGAKLVKLPVPLSITGPLSAPETQADLKSVDFKTAVSLAKGSFFKGETKPAEVKPVEEKAKKENPMRVFSAVQKIIGG
jgi:uncharacterized protein YhdP